MKLAIFDVDLTLTRRDTFIEFYKFLCKEDKRFCLYMNKAISSGLMYSIGLYDEKKSKEQYLSFLRGINEKSVEKICRKFFEEHLVKKLLYRDGILELERRKREGYVNILISASPEFYLKYFGELSCVDYVLGTKYEVIDGVYTGKMVGFNNKGREKVFRLYEFLHANKLSDIDFENSVMYSDSLHDTPLFNIVGSGFLINSKKSLENVSNLSWK